MIYCVCGRKRRPAKAPMMQPINGTGYEMACISM